VHDGLDAREHLGAAQRLERLTVVGQVGGEKRGARGSAGRIGRGAIDVEHLVAVGQQLAHDRATDLAASACDDDLHCRRSL